MLAWYQQVRTALDAEAEQRGATTRQLACTLLTAVIGETASIFAQIGDGVIVVRDGEGYVPVFWPQSGDYVNTTHFVTEHQFEQALQISRRAFVDEVALTTDGLQMLALNFASRSVHHGFFEPMFAALRNASEPDDLVVPMRSFLDSPDVNRRTDDDKTLVLAVRIARAFDPVL